MQKITNEMLEKAAKNAKHVKVKALDLRGLIFIAESKSQPGFTYRVRLMRALNGERFGECGCAGFSHAGYCRHLVACVAFVIGIQKMRQAVKAQFVKAQPVTPSLAEQIAAAPLIKQRHKEVRVGYMSV